MNLQTVNLNKGALATRNSNIVSLIEYSKNLNKLSSNLRDRNQKILNTKEQVAVLDVQIQNNNNPCCAPVGPTQLSSNLNSGCATPTRYYETIDMLNLSCPIGPRNKSIGLNQLEASNRNICAGGMNKNNNLNNNNKFNFDIARSQNINYQFNNSKNRLLNNISNILQNSFLTMSSLISKPVFNITPQKVVIHLFFFLVNNNKNSNLNLSSGNIQGINRAQYTTGGKVQGSATNKEKFLAFNSKNLELICANLSKTLNKQVELDLVRLHYPYHDSNILANLLGRICDINFKPYISILDIIYNSANIKNTTTMLPQSNSIIPTFLTGIKIRLAGRLLKQKIIPRQTVKISQHGSLTRSSSDIRSISRFTTKNRRGTFSITTTLGHTFF
uniref:Small ribosomal subunit protein uS3m n=1 Tax=Wolfiporia cocos TaxID=81056 RepID=A0A7G7YDW9_9APHY|nr:ribosomal protein S3 [Wolfiporia cocos]